MFPKSVIAADEKAISAFTLRDAATNCLVQSGEMRAASSDFPALSLPGNGLFRAFRPIATQTKPFQLPV